jgi:hypothetical protein
MPGPDRIVRERPEELSARGRGVSTGDLPRMWDIRMAACAYSLPFAADIAIIGGLCTYGDGKIAVQGCWK